MFILQGCCRINFWHKTPCSLAYRVKGERTKDGVKMKCTNEKCREKNGRKKREKCYISWPLYLYKKQHTAVKQQHTHMHTCTHTFLQVQRLGLLTSVVPLSVSGFSLQFGFLSKSSPLFPLYTGKKSKQMQKHHTKTYLLPCLQELSLFKDTLKIEVPWLWICLLKMYLKGNGVFNFFQHFCQFLTKWYLLNTDYSLYIKEKEGLGNTHCYFLLFNFNLGYIKTIGDQLSVIFYWHSGIHPAFSCKWKTCFLRAKMPHKNTSII